MFCNKCGKEIPEKAKFCPFCSSDNAADTIGPGFRKQNSPVEPKQRGESASGGGRTIGESNGGTGKPPKNRTMLKIGIIAAAAVVCCLVIVALSSKPPGEAVETGEDEIIPIVNLDDMALVEQANDEFMSFDGSDIDAIATDAASAIEALNAISGTLGFDNAADVLSPTIETDTDIGTFSRFEQYYEGIPVYARGMVVVTDLDGTVSGASGNYLNISAFDTKPQISEDDAIDVAKEYILKQYECEEESI